MSNFNHIQIDPAIGQIVDSAEASHSALLELQHLRRRQNRKRGIARSRSQVKTDLVDITADGFEIARIRANAHIMPIEHKRNMQPSNEIRLGFNDYMQDWHRSARTGETGKRSTRPAANDHRYTAHPFVPKLK